MREETFLFRNTPKIMHVRSMRREKLRLLIQTSDFLIALISKESKKTAVMSMVILFSVLHRVYCTFVNRRRLERAKIMIMVLKASSLLFAILNFEDLF